MSAVAGVPGDASVAPAAAIGTAVVAGMGHSAGIDGAASGNRGSSAPHPPVITTVASTSEVIARLVMGLSLHEQAFDHDKEQRNEEQAERDACHHAAEHAGADRALRA